MSRWKQGDTKPDMVIDCFDGSNRPAQLADAEIVKVIVSQRGAIRWEREASAIAGGTVTVLLEATDTATVGTFFVKVYAEWPDGSHQHYPPADEYLTMTVTR